MLSPLATPSPDALTSARAASPTVSRRLDVRVVLRDGLAGRGVRLEALFADWPAQAKADALARVRSTFGPRAGAAVFVRRDGHHVELVDLATDRRLRLMVPVGL
ncbi:hypothetical protein NBH00_20260 [Paraconexibacter antarcticus]|uniref:Uncharacterized protein n=1 Tax=Paraconexibacter antarcticus TaxID=2949664 RepID=A0ABY5DPW5_9ACTN|nr:hypothetical protein [Paraconexibacter antarcticus]UTI63664.1 hypothetical protein NBH00_20260 [Paraconexibacter antarcticus]